jgi:nucleoside-diphosphate-sugar epimerase
MQIGIIGLGHIGFPIASRLHSLGHKVHTWTRTERSFPWLNSAGFNKGIEIDFDSIFIASGGARPNFGDTNLELATTYDLISNFYLSKETKLFYISSGAVYGECATPQSETDNPRPTTDYGKAKLIAENKLQETYGDQLSVLRIGNIIDEVNPYGIVAHLVKSIQNGVFEVLGAPNDCRDYFGISDLLTCIDRLIKLQSSPSTLNLGSGISISLETIVLLLTETLGNRLDVRWKRRRPGDISQTQLDVTKMRLLLKNAPENPFKKIEDLINNLDLTSHLSN